MTIIDVGLLSRASGLSKATICAHIKNGTLSATKFRNRYVLLHKDSTLKDLQLLELWLKNNGRRSKKPMVTNMLEMINSHRATIQNEPLLPQPPEPTTETPFEENDLDQLERNQQPDRPMPRGARDDEEQRELRGRHAEHVVRDGGTRASAGITTISTRSASGTSTHGR